MRAILWMFGTAIGIALMVSALWVWGNANDLTAWTARPDVARWGARSGAVAIAALSQLVLLSFVIRTGRSRRFTSDFLRITCALVVGVSLVSAIALGLAGR